MGSVVAAALLATLYWVAIVLLVFLSYSFWMLIAGACGFALLVRVLSDGKPGASWSRAWLGTAASAVYFWVACWSVGIAAYVDSHGCAVAIEPCTGIGLMWPLAGGFALFYFLACWAALRARRNVL